MKQLLLAILVTAGLAGAPIASATEPIYINYGDIAYEANNAPEIDALAFVNLGSFSVSTILPFDTQNTLYFTNRGDMLGAVGFQFDLASSTQPRRPAAVFANVSGGSIRTREGVSVTTLSSTAPFFPTYLLVSATNILNEGVMRVNNAGLLQLQGQNINLAHGSFEVATLQSVGNVNAPQGYFYPEAAIYDYYWGTGTQPPAAPLPGANTPTDSGGIVRFSGPIITASAPAHVVTNKFGNFGQTAFSTYQALPFAYSNVAGGNLLTLTNQDGSTTNIFAPTNVVRQAVLVGISDPKVQVDAKFYPSPIGSPFQCVAVELLTTTTNVVTQNPEETTIFFVDRLAATTNLDVLTNYLSPVTAPTFRPAAYEVSRTPPLEFVVGASGNALLTKDFVYSTVFSNRFVTNLYAAYSCDIDYLAQRPPQVVGMGPTDQPGRVEIVAENLDLTKTRFRGEGLISVRTKNLVSSTNAVVDSPSLIYELGSTNGLLTVQSLAKEGVDRVSGSLLAWSGLWTNQMSLVFSNWFIDPTVPTNYPQPVTNPVDVAIHVLILDADFIQSTQQVLVYDFITHSTNVVMNDPITIARSMIIDANSFTLNGRISLPTAMPDWRYTNMPGLKFFTNAGVINVPNVANYGGDAPSGQQLSRFVNSGTLNANAHRIASDYYENRGTISSQHDLSVVAGLGMLDGGRDSTRGDTRFSGNDFKLRSYAVVCDGRLSLNVTNSLQDTGGDAKNQITCGNGFALLSKPKYGDLLGTAFASSAPQFGSVPHYWAAEDRGAYPAGFKDNAAIGRLSLKVFEGAELKFGPPQDVNGQPLPGKYGLYVDYLELQGSLQTNSESGIIIEPGLTIYFAAANVTAEDLDGKFGGQLRWVRDFAGPNSGVDVALRDGRTIRANIALVDSTTIDSDGDGLANGYDLYPFDGARIKSIQVANQQPLTVLLSWDAGTGTIYHVEKTANLAPPQWLDLGTVTNSSPVVQTVTFTNTVSGSAPAEGQESYYRVRYDP